MNHIKAMAIAQSMNRDRLDAADRRRMHARRTERPSGPRRPNVAHTIITYLVGLRARALPSR